MGRLVAMAMCLMMAAIGADARERVPPVAARADTRPPAPFTMPVTARVGEPAADGKGWKVNGEIGVSFNQAQAQFAAKVAAAGWAHLHTISLGRDRVLEAWSRGDQELTMMIWRIAPGRSGFSYGLSMKAGAGDIKE